MRLELECANDKLLYLGDPTHSFDFCTYVMMPKDIPREKLFKNFVLIKDDESFKYGQQIGLLNLNAVKLIEWRAEISMNIEYKARQVERSHASAGNSYWLVEGSVHVFGQHEVVPLPRTRGLCMNIDKVVIKQAEWIEQLLAGR